MVGPVGGLIMAGDFHARTQRLMDNPGGGKLIFKISFDQVYARYQHERRDLYHPRGGGPGYLRNALNANAARTLQALADATLRGNQSIAMIRAAQRTAQVAESGAPVETGELKKDAEIKVYDRGALIFHRPSKAPGREPNSRRRTGRPSRAKRTPR